MMCCLSDVSKRHSSLNMMLFSCWLSNVWRRHFCSYKIITDIEMNRDARSTHTFTHFNCRLIFVYKLNHEFIKSSNKRTNTAKMTYIGEGRRKGKILAHEGCFYQRNRTTEHYIIYYTGVVYSKMFLKCSYFLTCFVVKSSFFLLAKYFEAEFVLNFWRFWSSMFF